MKPKIWNEEEAKKANKDQLFFKLEMCDKHDDVAVIVVDRKGDKIIGGNLVIFDFDYQCLVIMEGINPVIGLKTGLDNELLYIEEAQLVERMKEKKHQQFIRAIFEKQQENIDPISKH